MWDRYRDWMYEWETRLNARDKNRVVRPLEWGLEWTEHWPCLSGTRVAAPATPEDYLAQLNLQIVSHSDEFFSYKTPSDFRREGDFLLFTSPVETPHEVNNLARARWFPAKGRRALIVMPQWNSDAEGHVGLAKLLNRFGVSALRMTMAYHAERKPSGLQRADYHCSANVGRTIHACRQSVIDARACLDWLEHRGYKRIGILGTSLGSCIAFIAAAHDPRIRTGIFNHVSMYFSDVVWTGLSTQNVRQGFTATIRIIRDMNRLLSPSRPRC